MVEAAQDLVELLQSLVMHRERAALAIDFDVHFEAEQRGQVVLQGQGICVLGGLSGTSVRTGAGFGPNRTGFANKLFGLAHVEAAADHLFGQAKQRGIYKGRKRGTTKAKPQRARQLREQGLNVPEIAKALGVTVVTVYRYLR